MNEIENDNRSITALHDPGNDALEYRNLGVQYFDSDDLVKAEEYFKKALEIDPNLDVARKDLLILRQLKLQYKLVKKGSLKQVRKRIKDLTPYQNRVPIEVKGKPLSETIIEERR